MSKSEYTIATISKTECSAILENWHYLSVMGLSKGFKSGNNFGLFYGGTKGFAGGVFGGELVGVCVFTGLPVPELSESMFGLDRDDQSGLFELSRLCLEPTKQKEEHNLASWFVSRCLREMKKRGARAILSYADADHHSGTVYAASNFTYHGMTTPKKDFWIKLGDGWVKHQRGSIKGAKGEWRDRSQKLRFLKIFDKRLDAKWEEENWGESALIKS